MGKEQIIKALECCQETMICAVVENNRTHFITNADALALIKELTAENEKLTINMNAYGLTAQRLAVREFAERVKNRIHSKLSYHGWYLKETIIDQIAKEILNENTEVDLK